jgi:hypothetical protein
MNAPHGTRQLAVVVPAFKPGYLSEALSGFVEAANRSLSLYVFDDCSPYPLEEIVRASLSGVNHFYHRFPSNLGGTDLAAHWNRCIDKTGREPWIWLFSDDDRVSPGSVKAVLSALSSAESNDLLALELQIIDAKGRPAARVYQPPAVESPADFAVNRLSCRRQLCAADHVFSRRCYERAGGFVSLPKAWYSDEVTWHRMLVQSNGRVVRVDGARLQFRLSGSNISTSRLHDRDKQDSQVRAWKYWTEYLASRQLDSDSLMTKWRRHGLLAAGLRPLSPGAFRHLRKMGRSNLGALADVTFCCILKLRVVGANLVGRTLRSLSGRVAVAGK